MWRCELCLSPTNNDAISVWAELQKIADPQTQTGSEDTLRIRRDFLMFPMNGGHIDLNKQAKVFMKLAALWQHFWGFVCGVLLFDGCLGDVIHKLNRIKHAMIWPIWSLNTDVCWDRLRTSNLARYQISVWRLYLRFHLNLQSITSRLKQSYSWILGIESCINDGLCCNVL